MIPLDSGAVFSLDRKKRFLLDRTWDRRLPILPFMMLNPSKAGERDGDMTITKCMGFGARWGFGGILVANLIATVSTDPFDLPPWSGLDPENQKHWERILRHDRVVLAWGSVPKSIRRSTAIAEHILKFREMAGDRKLYCIGYTVGGDPCHPSRHPYTRQMQEWAWND